MATECQKTGCHVWFPEYGEYGWGDAFVTNGVTYFQLVAREREPINGYGKKVHYTVHRTGRTFGPFPHGDLSREIVIGDIVEYHGYEGADHGDP